MFARLLVLVLASAVALLIMQPSGRYAVSLVKESIDPTFNLDEPQLVFRLGSGALHYPRTLPNTNATTAAHYMQSKILLGFASLNMWSTKLSHVAKAMRVTPQRLYIVQSNSLLRVQTLGYLRPLPKGGKVETHCGGKDHSAFLRKLIP